MPFRPSVQRLLASDAEFDLGPERAVLSFANADGDRVDVVLKAGDAIALARDLAGFAAWRESRTPQDLGAPVMPPPPQDAPRH